MNLFRDYFNTTLGAMELTSFNAGLSPRSINESHIDHPTETIVFGEKKTGSTLFYVDLTATLGGAVSATAEQRRHKRTTNERAGGSNYGFADGSVKYLPFGRSTLPVNLWGVTGPGRTNHDELGETR